MITVLNEQRETRLPTAQAEGESLWLDAAGIAQSLNWTWKPEGLCQDETCVPVPRGQAAQMVRGGQLDIAAMWRHMSAPVVHDAAADTWVFGAASEQRTQTLRGLSAPDFELPDLAGTMHRLSDYRGQKVLLVTWASW
jgi:hypothetical protein